MPGGTVVIGEQKAKEQKGKKHYTTKILLGWRNKSHCVPGGSP